MALVSFDLGKMARRVELQRITTARTASGAQTEALTTVATIWAAVDYGTGDEKYEADKLTAFGIVNFTIRYREVRMTDQIAYNGQLHDVVHTEELGRQQYLKIKTRVKQ